MLNRSEVLRSAWQAYWSQCRAIPGFKFSRRLFARHLASAWREARGREALEAMVAAEPAYSPRVAEIRNELLAMDLSDAPMNWDRRRDLNLELFRLSAEEAPARHA